MRNKHRGVCMRCTRRVEPLKGYIMQTFEGKTLVVCEDCARLEQKRRDQANGG